MFTKVSTALSSGKESLSSHQLWFNGPFSFDHSLDCVSSRTHYNIFFIWRSKISYIQIMRLGIQTKKSLRNNTCLICFSTCTSFKSSATLSSPLYSSKSLPSSYIECSQQKNRKSHRNQKHPACQSVYCYMILLLLK